MTTDALMIGLDLGTSAVKGVLTDAAGRVLAVAGADTPLLHPRPGWVEVDPEDHYSNVGRVIRELASTAPGPVTALAMAAASGNTLLTDAGGAPLTPIINWMDARAEHEPPAALAGLTVEEVKRVTGWPCVTSFPLAHLAWLRENRPDLYRRAGRYAMDTDWLLHRLTGRWLMDHSAATTFHLQDQLARAWHRPFLDRLDIPAEKLSRLVPSGVPAGPPTARAQADTGLSAETVIATGCFDHPAAARATGVLAPGRLMLSCGTSWVGFAPCEDRAAALDAGMLVDPFLTDAGGPWGGIFSVPRIGRAVEWYIDHAIAPGEPDRMRVFNERAAESAPGAGGLEIDLSAEPAAVDGTRADIARAVMEGAARLLNALIEGLEAHGFAYEDAVLVGGPSASPIWPDIISEITGMRLTVGSRHSGAEGAAILAGIAAGVYADEHAALRARGRAQ